MSTKKEPGYGKILDAWVRPTEAGDPVGCIATTFTFDAAFFEEECLSRFLQFDSDPIQDGPTYLIERDAKLAELSCASVLVDQHYCIGMRSLRWDLLPARVKSAILHSKVCLLHWSNWVRLIISSANLDSDGYRKNQEIFGVLDYYPESEAPLQCLNETLDFLKQVANYASDDPQNPAIQRWKGFVEKARSTARSWGNPEQAAGKRSVAVYPVFSGPGYPTVLEKLGSLWPGSTRPYQAYILSTYFDLPEKENKPAKQIWNLLREKGWSKVEYYITVEDLPDGKSILLNAPESLLKAQPSNRSQIETSFMRVFPSTDIEKEKNQFRPLHLKCIYLENDNWTLNLIGSSNFSSIGLGFLKDSNIEANLAYAVHKENSGPSKQIDQAFPGADDLNEDLEWRWTIKRELNADEPAVELLLPKFFDAAVFDKDGNQNIIRFVFGNAPVTGWSISRDRESLPFYDENKWNEEGCPLEVRLVWSEDRPPAGFRVKWYGAEGSAWWPVILKDYSVLPTPQELKDLPLELLLRIYTSARSPYKLIIKWKGTHGNGSDWNGELDPHKRVDTSAFLLQRTRRLSWLLQALRERLERPVPTVQALEWRLRGPVGVIAIADAIKRESKSELEKMFLTAELALELQRVHPKEKEGYVSRSTVKMEIQKLISELQAQVNLTSFEGSPLMKAYVEKVFSG